MTENSSRERLVARFRKYIHFSSASNPNSDACPSSDGQMDFARYLADELRQIGLTEVTLDSNGYIMGTLPANDDGSADAPVVGFIAHMDTSPDAPAEPMEERIVQDYDGGDIVLNEEAQVILSPGEFPELLKYKGQDIMVTNGLTLLGADDKAGVCEIVSAMEYLREHPEIKHGKIRIGFTPDEEIGRGSDLFDVAAFGADFAYTMDGDELGGLEYENFNAANVTVRLQGRNVHPGSAKGKMINAVKLAAELQQMLPADECPECTEGYQGFFHVQNIRGDVEAVTMGMLIRDHDRRRFEERKELLLRIASEMNEKYGAGTATAEIKDSYYNMKEKLLDKMFVVDIAREAMLRLGIEPVIKPVRGGTDGARLSFMGLPCPNIFTGGQNYHSRCEYLPLQSMEKAMAVIVEIVKDCARQTR